MTLNGDLTATRVISGLIIVLGGLTIVLTSFWITLTILNTRDENLIFALEDNIDRPGADFRDFDLPTDAAPQVCQQECQKENHCREFVYKRPAVKGQRPHCWLKDAVTEGMIKNDHVSGVVRP